MKEHITATPSGRKLLDKALEPSYFRHWMAAVDQLLEGRHGLNSADLPDCPYYDWYEHGMTAYAAAGAAVRNARGEE